MATEALVNGLSLMKLEEEAVTKYTSQVIRGIKTINRAISKSNVMVYDHIDGVSLSWLENNIAYINRNCSIKGPLVFKNQCFINGSLNVNGLVNQINLGAAFADAVTLLENDAVEGQKEFDIAVVKNMHVEQNAEIEGLVNSVNISFLYQDVLQTDGNHVTNGVKNFKKSVQCLNELQLIGLVNGIDLGTDVVSSHRNQKIFGMKSFDEGLNAIGNIAVSEFSDGYDLSEISEDTALKANMGMQHVTGMKTIKKGTVFMQSMFASGNVDGFNFSANEPITLSADQTLSEPVVFKNALKAESGIRANNSNLVKRLKSIESRRVLLNQDQEIQGNYQFAKNIQIQETFKVHGLTSGGNLTLLKDSVDGLSAAVRQAESMQGNTCKMLNYMQRVFESVPLQIDYFEDYQIFDKLQTKEMYPFTIGDDRFIAVAVVWNKTGCTTAKILKFDITHNNFTEHQILPIKGTHKFTFFVESGVEYLVAAADARPCSTTSTSVLYKLDRNTKMFIRQQILSSDNIVDVLSYNDGGGQRIVFVISSQREHYEFNLQILKKTTDVFKAVTTHNVGDYRMRCIASHRIGDVRFLAVALSPRIGLLPETQYIFKITNDDFYVHQLLNEHNVHNIAFFNHLSSTYLVMSLQIGIGVPTGKKGYTSLLTLSSSKYFHHLMSIPVENPIQVKTFNIKGQTFILVLHLHAGFTLFRFRTNAVLEKLLKVPHIGLEQISRFDINGTHYLTMAANWPDKLTTHRVQRIPNSKILKLITSGIDQRYTAAKKEDC
ncbi:uncharacterized protein LOC135691595 [Rhopilema esculentum]|uniref:uncharacterized protein LOC135691595 n=1 Tax=Rhopilema esculentum TaxID=499914 RepID=UPI0031E03256